MYKKFLLAALLASGPAFAAPVSPSLAQSYQKMVSRLNKRYHDFFNYQRQLRRQKQRRLAGLAEYKQQKKMAEEEHRRARADYALHVKQEPSHQAQKVQHDRMLARKRAAHDNLRKDYSRLQNHVKQIESTARKIPENQEYGL